MKHKWTQFYLLLIIFQFCFAVHASQIPEVLQPWQDWVLKDHEAKLCPQAWNQANNHFCEWPAKLELDIQSENSSFTQQGVLFNEGWVELPGDQQAWPVEVTNHAKSVSVVLRHNRPQLFLEKGEYNIQGKFNWSRVPQKLTIGKDVGIINLKVEQQQVHQVQRDKRGFIWLKKVKKTKKKKQENSIGFKVFKKITDSIPQESMLLVRLQISGVEREETIGPVLAPNSAPIHIYSPLPAKLENNGQLKLQVKPGIWDIYIRSRFLSQQNEFSMNSLPEPWPAQEVWVFQHENQLRRVELSGARALDPTQTDMPNDWKNLPTFLMEKKVTLKLEEKHRGRVQERGESLRLNRQIWLDFDGKGMTFKDNLTGLVEEGWRLSTITPLKLGQVEINGQPKLITTLGEDQKPGVEIRNGHLNLSAISRMDSQPTQFQAIGWDRDVQSLQASLYLPPGWKLFNAMGVDKVSEAWLRDWNLLDLFLVLFISLSFMKLLGLKWGGLSLVTLGLIYHEPGAPLYSWLAVLASIGLLKVLPKGMARTGTNIFYAASLGTLVLLSIPFIGKQIQTALYPQLSKADSIVTPYSAQPVMGKLMAEDRAQFEGASADVMESVAAPVRQLKKSVAKPYVQQEKELTDYDPNAKVQTGPSVPNWSWKNINLSWQGPVTQDQMLTLWLLPSWIVSVLKFLQVALVILLIYALIKPFKKEDFSPFPEDSELTTTKSIASIFLIPLVFVLSNFMIMNEAKADIPDQTLLNQLRDHLLAPPECMPNCADLSRAQVELSENQLTMRLVLDAIDSVAMPLPNIAENMGLQNVLLNGEPAKALRQDHQSNIWIALDKGQHEVVLISAIQNLDQVNINFDYRLKPKWVSVQAQGWNYSGVSDDKLLGQSLQLTRQVNSNQTSTQKSKQLTLSEMPRFVTYSKKVKLGLDWRVFHQVTRVAPQYGVIHLEIPLMKDEKILSDNVKVVNQIAKVQLAKGQNSVFWQSELKIAPSLELKAIESPEIKEVWSVQAVSKWHPIFEGIPYIHQRSQSGTWLPQWQPWPKEMLKIAIIKPEPLPGNTISLDQTRYQVNPGLRQSDHELEMNIRSSQGDQHTITLPKDIEIRDVYINQISQPINLEGEKLTFPLKPGAQRVKVQWRSPDPLTAQLTLPNIDVGMDATNNYTQVNVSKDRWLLYITGPQIGPVVQFWAVVILMVLIAIALGASGHTPLAIWQWILLGLGVTLSTPLAALVVISWFVVMQLRKNYGGKLELVNFQLLQAFIVLLTFLFIISLITCISTGLLGNPQMQLGSPQTSLVQSNFFSNNAYQLKWYQDQIHGTLSNIYVLSIPLFVYRILMLLWALWLAFSLLKWIQWGWKCYTQDGLWKISKSD